MLLSACAPTEVDLAEYKCPDCNVILISIDTFRGDHLTCAGYDKYEVDITKNICDFAKKGTLFTNAISHSGNTYPSHASIMTSSIPSNHHGFNFHYPGKTHQERKEMSNKISSDKKMLAEVFKEKGYQTAAFTGGGWTWGKLGFERGFDIYDDNSTTTFQDMALKGLEWLKQTKQPFFLFLHTYELHSPYTPKQEYAKTLDPAYNGTLGKDISEKLLDEISEGNINLTENDLQHVIAMYDAEIMSVDNSFGKLIEELRKNNLLNNTIIIVTSDHGEEFQEHGSMRHSHTLYNELLHVPLIVYAPLAAPSIKDYTVQSIDIAPTILTMLNISIPETFEGNSLFAENKRHVISELSDAPIQVAVQTKQWKYYEKSSRTEEIFVFDLLADSKEKNNVIQQHPAIIAEYTAAYKNTVNSNGTKKEQIEVSKEAKEQLKSLGYIT